MVPIPVFPDFEALNAHLLESCRKRLSDRLRGHDGTIGERLAHDLTAFQKPLPAPYDACEKRPGRVVRCRWFATGTTTARCRRPRRF